MPFLCFLLFASLDGTCKNQETENNYNFNSFHFAKINFDFKYVFHFLIWFLNFRSAFSLTTFFVDKKQTKTIRRDVLSEFLFHFSRRYLISAREHGAFKLNVSRCKLG